jgi:S-DNA-T family DNA segregation ATPase FtsK/SpoIIIE
LQVGYPRAARLVDRLHELGFVGPFEGSKPRKVLVTPDQFERMLEGDEAMEGGDIFD